MNTDPASSFTRDALTKMKDVYVKNPQMGDPTSVDPRLAEIAGNIEKLQSEVQKFEVGLACKTEPFPKSAGFISRDLNCTHTWFVVQFRPFRCFL